MANLVEILSETQGSQFSSVRLESKQCKDYSL
jgi:hypothetical protein